MQAVLLVDHGSRRPASNDQLAQVVQLVREQLPTSIPVSGAHMELAQPCIEDAIAALASAGATEVFVVPYMLAPGRHAAEDIPRLAQRAAVQHPGVRVTVSDCLGVDVLLAQLVVRRAMETGLRPLLRQQPDVGGADSKE